MLDQQLLLGRHARRAARPRPDRAKLLQIAVGPAPLKGMSSSCSDEPAAAALPSRPRSPKRNHQAATARPPANRDCRHEERQLGESRASRWRLTTCHNLIFDGSRQAAQVHFSSCPNPPESAILPQQGGRQELGSRRMDFLIRLMLERHDDDRCPSDSRPARSDRRPMA